MASNTVGAILLAGGKSSRMGQDKALLNFQGMRLVDHMYMLLKKIGMDPIWVSGRDYGYPWVADCVQEQGPLGGLASVISKRFSRGQWIFVLPVDMPLLSENRVGQLLAERHETVECVLFENHELPALFRVSEHLIFELNKICGTEIPKSLRSFRELYSRLHLKTVSLSGEINRELVNVNRPQEWSQLMGEKNL